ncbi:protein FANTASTIC FOUR 3-like [Salvia miltiorrhiza]|uniref:protein FANTASTIC FOUR 3-like n=1 Tax=Salvia miltiorrhiza TaxID=226208 RepID=UPI0025AB64BF|nr:protein FANTASTIC FOUR 3-like [Salvia miltiorrhiza]
MPCNSNTSQISKPPHLESPAPQPNSPFPWAHPDNQNTDCRDNNTRESKPQGCWDFLQNATNTTSHGFMQTATKPSAFLLSTKGLEMCTEILGSESGSSIDPSLDICSQHSSKIKPRKTKHTTSFPPPLTSIASGYGVKVQAHRGGGRLLISVVASSSSACRIFLKSEREHGRLRVFLHKDYYYRRSDHQLPENIKENGRKLRRNFKCGDESGNKNLTSLPLCVAFT